jgi:nucleolar protein 12
VGNLPLDTNSKSLAKLFADCGTVSSARIRSVPVTPVKVSQKGDKNLVRRVAFLTKNIDSSIKTSVHGYVVFESQDSVAEALKRNNMMLPGDKHRIRVDCAQPTWMENTKRCVFVGNIAFDDPNGESDLQKHFAKHCGCSEEEIEGVRLIRDKTSYLCKGFGYVLFANNQLQSTALRVMPGTTYKNRTLRVMACTKSKKKKTREGGGDEQFPLNGSVRKKSAPQDNNNKMEMVGALKRILVKEHEVNNSKKKKNVRPRGTTNKSTVHKAAVSKQSKVNKMERKVRKFHKKVDKEKR